MTRYKGNDDCLFQLCFVSKAGNVKQMLTTTAPVNYKNKLFLIPNVCVIRYFMNMITYLGKKIQYILSRFLHSLLMGNTSKVSFLTIQRMETKVQVG